MVERFTDRARQVLILAQEQARVRGHDHIGTEHILLGLVQEGEGVAAQVLESLGVSLEEVRQQVEQAVSPGRGAPSGHIPFTPQAKKVLDLSRREALQLGHNHIGTEHLLLGLIREGEGHAAHVLAGLGADPSGARQRVQQLLHGYRAQAGLGTVSSAQRTGLAGGTQTRLLLSELLGQAESMNSRLSAIEKRMGTGPDTADLDQRIAQTRRDKESAIDAEDYEKAATLRNAERLLVAEKGARQQEGADTWPDLPTLADGLRRLSDEVDRLHVLLRQQGIEPQDGAA
jgi:ATP-dependent Clp protease ATP-binding subunit ClpC